MTNLSSPTSGSLLNLGNVDQQFFRDMLNGEQELEPLLRQLEEGRCPISSLPADQCASCAKKDPRHYPRGLTGKIRTVLQKLLQQTREAVSLLSTGRDGTAKRV